MCQEELSKEEEQKETSSEIPKPLPNESWLNRNSTAIIAFTAIGSFITTFVLAVIAFYSWNEVKIQRNLAFKQFVVANAPSVQTYVLPGERFQFDDDKGWLYWEVVNTGGPVYDLDNKAILLYFYWRDEIELDSTRLVIRTDKRDRLNRESKYQTAFVILEKNSLEWLKSEVDNQKDNFFLYVRVEYTIPAELRLDGKPTRDVSFRLVGWNPHTKDFRNVRSDLEDYILQKINEQDYLSKEDCG